MEGRELQDNLRGQPSQTNPQDFGSEVPKRFGSTAKALLPDTNKLNSLGNIQHRKIIGEYERKLVTDLQSFFRGLILNAAVPPRRKKISAVMQAAHFAREGSQSS